VELPWRFRADDVEGDRRRREEGVPAHEPRLRGLPSSLSSFDPAEGNCAVIASLQTPWAKSIQPIPYFSPQPFPIGTIDFETIPESLLASIRAPREALCQPGPVLAGDLLLSLPFSALLVGVVARGDGANFVQSVIPKQLAVFQHRFELVASAVSACFFVRHRMKLLAVSQ
jgi:hypothetical protein